MKYNIGDIVAIKTYRYTLITPIIAIRDYTSFHEYIVYGIDIGFTEEEIIGRVDSVGNIIF